MIRKGKDCYRRKMEHQLQQNNICGVWKGLKTISGFKEPKSQPVGDQGWANDLNLFFNRFDQASAPPPAQSPLLQPPSRSVPPPPLMTFRPQQHPPRHFQFTLCPAPLPPSTPPCSSLLPHITPDQLCGIFGYTFNLSLKLGRVPQLWKTSCIVPVPKTPHPKELNSYRPVALTSHLMKTLERLVLAHLRPLVSSFMDPLQFAYQSDTSGRRHSPPAPVSIQGTDIDTVKSYKYLGVHLNDSLDWSDNTNVLVKKGNSRLVPAQEAEVFFGVQGPLLRTFYDSVVASAIFYWDSLLGQQHHGQGQEENGQTVNSAPNGENTGGLTQS
ncbi:hypothetical protein L3Q82_000652 [Scortum barcoo]|uniref:Uncharacterized protein n=1 Tax=Scortum barcoo TaxID=214431 RepID=A0ACB8WF10_9TELE|nr:hypothetical protein L3Q82_000652 [Scortum barcoo]